MDVRTQSLSEPAVLATHSLCRVCVPGGYEGTGFAVGDGSTVVTAAHVVGSVDDVVLQFHSAPPVKARVWKRGHENSDVALLRFHGRAPHVMSLAPDIVNAGQLIAWRFSQDLHDLSPRIISVQGGGTVFPPHTQGFPRVIIVGEILDHGMSGGPVFSASLGAAVGVLVELQRLNAAALARLSDRNEDEVAAALRANDVGYMVDVSAAASLLT